MDSITHTVLGACTGELIAGRKLGRKAMLVGAIVNNLPDIDMLANFFVSDARGLLTHRGITHSLLFAVAGTFIFSALCKRYLWRGRLELSGWRWLIGHGLLLHIIMDSFTTYGTGVFEPFSHYRVSLNTLFILEPSFMLFILLGTIILLIVPASKTDVRKRISVIALTLSGFYLLITIIIKLYMNQLVKSEMKMRGWKGDEFTESPTPFNNVMWYVIIKHENNYHAGYYSLFDKSKRIVFYAIEKQDSLLTPYLQVPDVKNLLHFSKGFYSIKREAGKLTFSDMRFGQTGMDNLSDVPFVFNFDIIPASDGSTTVKQSEFKDLNKDDVKKLFNRIGGI